MKAATLIIVSLFSAISAAIAFDPALTSASAESGAAPGPTPSQIVEVYGHPQGEPNVQLKWAVYEPAGSPPWPAVLVIHAGGFKAGSRDDASLIPCANDLADAGYLALSITYRLAPPGQINGQRQAGDDGRFPKQSQDVQTAIRAARADPRCNGLVGAVGGSAGATHAAVGAGIGTLGEDRLDVAVCLSGAYDFSDFRNDPEGQFQNNVTNYIGTRNITLLRNASPVSQIDSNVSPLFLVNTVMDPMPFTQLGDMVTQLRSLGVNNFDSTSLPGQLHAFDYWPQVKGPALRFLSQAFARASHSSIGGF